MFPTTRQVELIGKKEFAVAALDLEHKVFVLPIDALSIDSDDKAHSLRKAQIAYLKADEAPTEVSSEYADFTNIFSPKLTAELPKHTGINDYVIKLVDDRQF